MDRLSAAAAHFVRRGYGRRGDQSADSSPAATSRPAAAARNAYVIPLRPCALCSLEGLERAPRLRAVRKEEDRDKPMRLGRGRCGDRREVPVHAVYRLLAEGDGRRQRVADRRSAIGGEKLDRVERFAYE